MVGFALFASPPSVGWNEIKLGNGGVIARISIANDGTAVCGTDTFGAYIWNPSLNRWTQFLKTTIMPTAALPDGLPSVGCDEVVVDPSNSNNIWFLFNSNLYKSTDKGVTFSLLSNFPTQPVVMANISPQKAWGPYIAVDPNNSLVAYVSTPSRGLYFTNDGGATFSLVPTAAAGLPNNSNNNPGSPSNGTNSTDSITVGTGLKSFNHNSTAFGFTVGTSNYVQVWRTSDPSISMVGAVTASGGTTFTINVDFATGAAGPFTDWTVCQLYGVLPVSFDQENGGGHRVVYDTSGGTTTVGGQTRTANVFMHTYNVNTWKSTNGGSSWTPTTVTNRPGGLRRVCCDPFGVLWALTDDYPASATNLTTYDTTTWTTISIPSAGSPVWFDQVSVDVANSGSKATTHVAIFQGASIICSLTVDGGAHFNTTGNSSANLTYISSGDVDWLLTYRQANPTSFFGAAAVAFDPSQSGRLYIGAEGVWYCVPQSTGSNLTLTQQTRGVEQFIANRVLSPSGAGNSVLMATWDFPIFYSNTFSVYPSAISGTVGPNQTNLERGNSIDWVASSPATIIALIQDGTGGNSVGLENSGKSPSPNGGTPTTWTKFTNPGSVQAGGAIVAADALTYLWVAAANANIPTMTTDGGTNWNPISIPGGTPTSFWGPLFNGATTCRVADSDKATGDLYLYNVNANGAGSDAIYKYTKLSGLWSTQVTPTGFVGSTNFNEIMKSSGVAQNIFFSGGLDAFPHPQNKPFYYTTDGWATKSTVTNFKEVLAFGFGAPFAGHSFPSIYAAGWNTGVYGIWMCKDWDTAKTWTQIGPYPLNISTIPVDIDGDKTTPGKVYVATNGGFFWGQFN